ncbi:MAG: hypothetical protein ACXWV5_08100 [Flavitalea sp.]
METDKRLNALQSKFVIPLFPNYFKKIGIGILVLFFVPALIFKLTDNQFYLEYKQIFRQLTTSVFILGLFLIVWSKEKAENQFTQMLRYRALALTFLIAVFHVLLSPVIDLFFNDPLVDNKAIDVILNMLMVYLFIFYLTRKAVPPTAESSSS